jgi:hypothetical protein
MEEKVDPVKQEQVQDSPTLFYGNIKDMINQDSILTIKQHQTDAFVKISTTNSKLNDHLILSESKYKQAAQSFESKKKMIQEMKSDLEYITRKVKQIQKRHNIVVDHHIEE